MRKVVASQTTDSEILFTSSAILDLLSKIEEFNQYDLSLSETLDGALQLQVGDSFYELNPDEIASDIQVEDKIVDEIATINEEAYENLIEDGSAEDVPEPVESGLIKEIVKTLLVGGVVRMGKHYLTH